MTIKQAVYGDFKKNDIRIKTFSKTENVYLFQNILKSAGYDCILVDSDISSDNLWKGEKEKI